MSQDTLVAFDSNVLSYFLQANQAGYDPASDPDPVLAAERVAAFRLFLYMERAFVVPTVEREAKRIRDAIRRDEHRASFDFSSTRSLSRTWTPTGFAAGPRNLHAITRTRMIAARSPKLRAERWRRS